MNIYVDTLMRARRGIANRSETYICNAVRYFGRDPLVNCHIIDTIQNRIDPTGVNTTLDGWLSENSAKFRKWGEKIKHPGEYRDEMRAYRLRWIDALIAEYQ